MNGLADYEKALFFVQVAALVGVLVRIVTSGLQKIYRFFFLYTLAALAQICVPLLVSRSRDPNFYAQLYFATEGVVVCFYALVVLELYSLVLRDLHGLATIARRYIRFAIAGSIVFSILILSIEPVPGSLLARFFTFESTIVSSLVFFVLLITMFLVYYPIPLNRNVIYYSIGYAFYFTSKAAGLFLLTAHRGGNRVVSLVLLAMSTSCLAFWAVSLTREGEKKMLVFGHQWNPQDEQRLLEQLEAINSNLLRARK